MKLSAIRDHALRAVALAMALFHLYTAMFGLLDALLQRGLHLLFALVLLLLMHPLSWGAGAGSRILRTFLDVLVAAMAIVPLLYITINYEYLTDGRIQYVSDLSTSEMLFGASFVVALLELCRRVTGPVLPVVCIVFLVYLFIPGLPGVLEHNGYTLAEALEFQYMTLSGIFGSPLAASANFIVLFILFGAFLERSGLGGFVMDFTIGLFGRYRGGPAKVAVVSSALTGTISGSAMANVLTTGTVTIPLMKRTGYPAHMAGAIEAAASTGGALMPPVMGTVAFIMSEFSGVPYGLIALYALIPALLYYLGIFCTVHFAAVRYDAKGLEAKDLPDWRAAGRERWHLFIPIVLLVYLLALDYSPQFSVTYSILAVIVVSWFRKSTRLGPRAILEALESGAKGAVLVAVATACAGIIVGVFDQTTVGVKLAQQGNALAGTLFAGLVITMLVSLFLGMGVPPTVSYLAQVVVTIPMLQLFLKAQGLDPYTAKVVTHFFVMYFATIAVITPPDALASIAAAGVAGSPVMKTAAHGTRLAFVAFIVPFMFVYRPALLTLGTWDQIAYDCFFAFTGVIVLAAALEGYALRKLSLLERLLAFAAGFALVVPYRLMDWIGLALIAVLMWLQYVTWTRARVSAEAGTSS
ncbi:MAG: TRAP transporter permease [Beijerinckiaceae bacterium]